MSGPNRFRSYPAVPYPLLVPDHLWDETIREVADYAVMHSEALVFWGGIALDESCVVTGVYLQGHRPQGARVALTGEESRWLLRRLRDRDEKLLAQVHSHPGDAFHSHGDDRHATSYHPGAYSIVIPNYGLNVTTPDDCAIYTYQPAGFQQVDPTENIRVVRLVENRVPEVDGQQTKATERRGWWKWLTSTLRLRATGHSEP